MIQCCNSPSHLTSRIVTGSVAAGERGDDRLHPGVPHLDRRAGNVRLLLLDGQQNQGTPAVSVTWHTCLPPSPYCAAPVTQLCCCVLTGSPSGVDPTLPTRCTSSPLTCTGHSGMCLGMLMQNLWCARILYWFMEMCFQILTLPRRFKSTSKELIVLVIVLLPLSIDVFTGLFCLDGAEKWRKISQ